MIKSVSCGEEHTALISSKSNKVIIGEGFLYTMGNNSHGRLGLGNQSLTNTSIPCLVEGLVQENIISVSCGATHTVALTNTGNIYSWGLGEFGALGTGNTMTMHSPTRIEYFTQKEIKVTSISCGDKHTLFATRSFFIRLNRR